MEQLDNQVVCSACGERYNLEEIPAYAALELEKEELAKKVRELGKKGKDYDFLTDYLSTTTLGKLVMQISALEAENATLRKRLDLIHDEPVGYWIDLADEAQAEIALLRKRLEEMELKEGE